MPKIVPFKRRFKPIPMLGPPTQVFGSDGKVIYDTTHDLEFELRRSKKGAVIMMKCGLTWWALRSTQDQHVPSGMTFAEARDFVQKYVARYGQTITEIKKPRSPRYKKTDYALLRAGGAKEEWLTGDNHNLFAEAAMHCKHAGGHCMQDGFCHFGDCFDG